MPINFLSSIDANTMVLVAMFVIILAFVNYILGRVFRDSKGTAAIISICVSLLSVYGINRLSWDLTGIFSNIGISEDILYLVTPILIILAVILFARKFGLGKVLIILGILLIATSFLPAIYEKSLIITLGIVSLVIGIIFAIRRSKEKKIEESFIKQERYKQMLQSRSGRRALRQQIRQQRIQQGQQNAYNTGRKIGRGLGRVIYGKNKKRKVNRNAFSSGYNTPDY